MPGDLAVTVTNPTASQVLTAPAFVAEWNHTRVSDGLATTQNDYRVRIYDTGSLTYQQLITDSSPHDPDTGVSDASLGGTLPWTNPGNIATSNDVDATCPNASGATAISEALKATGCGFALPSDAEVLGVKVDIERKSDPAGGVSTPVVQATSTAVATSSGTAPSMTATPPKPSGTVSGDLLLAYVATHYNVSSDMTNFTAPAGWTLRATLNFDRPGTSGTVRVYSLIAGASEPSQYSFSVWYATDGSSGTSYMTVSMLRVDGHDPAVPFDVIPAFTDTGNNSVVTADSISTSVTHSLLIGMFAGFYGTAPVTWTPPTGMTELTDQGLGSSSITGPMGMEIAYQNLTSMGATGSRTATPNSGFTHCFGLLMAVKSASATGPRDERVSLVVGGAIRTTNRAKTTKGWSSAGDAIETYGSDVDTWGETLTAADVNAATFGVAIAATIPNGGVAAIDHILVTLTYRYADQLNVVTAPLYDSGQLASAIGQHSLAAGWGAQNSQTYYIRVDVTDAAGLEGASELRQFSTSWTPPPSVTGVTVTPRGGSA